MWGWGAVTGLEGQLLGWGQLCGWGQLGGVVVVLVEILELGG